MIKLHPRQSDCARHTYEQGNASTLNFTSLIAPSICALMHTKRVKTDATIFKPRCSRTGMCYRLDRVQALPLVSTRILRLANSSPKTARSPARRLRDGREPSHKNSGEMSRSVPHNFPAIAGRWKSQCRRISSPATRETTRNLARNHPAATMSPSEQKTMQHPAKHPARRLVEVLPSRFKP
jgi:hypothetical protein